MVIRSLGILFISVLSLSPALAQETADLEFILKSNPIEVSQQRRNGRMEGKEGWKKGIGETSELKLFSMGLIRFYQKFISTQDLPVCNFTPSCSRFGMAAIQKYGFLCGALLTADRLTRDHGMIATSHYPIDAQTGKYVDPVEAYSREALRKSATWIEPVEIMSK